MPILNRYQVKTCKGRAAVLSSVRSFILVVFSMDPDSSSKKFIADATGAFFLLLYCTDSVQIHTSVHKIRDNIPQNPKKIKKISENSAKK